MQATQSVTNLAKIPRDTYAHEELNTHLHPQ